METTKIEQLQTPRLKKKFSLLTPCVPLKVRQQKIVSCIASRNFKNEIFIMWNKSPKCIQ